MPDEPKIIFPHIAKTGGTAILYHFRQHLGDNRMLIFGKHNRCVRFFANQWQIEELAHNHRTKCNVIQGHGIQEQTLGLLNDPSFKLMIVLREPAALTRSRFSHRVNALKRRGASIDGGRFLRKRAGNVMTKRLISLFPSFVDKGITNQADKAISVLRKFDYVFTTDKLNVQAAAMMQFYGLPADIKRRRVTGDNQVDIGATDAQILVQNRFDQRVFEAFDHIVDTDGSSHNAIGVDRIGRDKALANIVTQAPTGEALKSFCYYELVRALALDLQLEKALRKIEFEPSKVAIGDLEFFHKILTRKWQVQRAKYSPTALEVSAQRARNWMQRFNYLE